ncbi:MAG: 50S ribosomal protein L11 methyltransferase [Candidatus Marinimicrobia bacterium]|nr:50S ribosomal protein L11 methyltransferase [Candidatus Neomarinimicrobiota bacterium]
MKSSPVLNWIELSVSTESFTPDISEALVAILVELCGGIEELADQSVVLAYVPANDSGKSITALIQSEFRQIAGVNNLDPETLLSAVKTRTIQNVDWAANWKEFYRPQQVGKNFLIYPSWEKPDQVTQSTILIQLDPGQAFGTGQHESTQLCLELLETIPVQNKRIADVGCGSGILSIAAAKLGASEVQACDIDPLAVEATTANAKINNVSEKIATSLGGASDLLTEAPVDLIFANIIAEALLRIGEDLYALMGDSSQMIWSGIVRERTEKIEKYLQSKNLKIQKKLSMGEWFSYLIAK